MTYLGNHLRGGTKTALWSPRLPLPHLLFELLCSTCTVEVPATWDNKFRKLSTIWPRTTEGKYQQGVL